MRSLTPFLIIAFVAAALPAQPGIVQLNYPSGSPWDALRPNTLASGGYPVRNPANWPVSTNVGHIDGDEHLDMVYCLEQRIILAVGFNRDAQGHPTTPFPIWGIFDPVGDVNKSFWGGDTLAVSDFDGDGDDEVAYVARGSNGSFFLRVIKKNPPPCTTGCRQPIGTLLQPQWAAEANLDTVSGGWSFRVRNGNTNIRVGVANVRGLASARDIVVSQNQSNEAQVFSYSQATGLTLLHNIPYRGQETHEPHYFDVTGDGKDDCLSNGVYDFHGCSRIFCAYEIARNLTGFCGSHTYDHADAIQPIGDLTGDGRPELVVVDDEFSKIMVGGASTGCAPGVPLVVSEPQLLSHHARVHTSANPFPEHGQTVAIGRFLTGADRCGVSGLQVLCAPKGPPYQNGTSPWGSFLMNSQMNILASSLTIANGPTGWVPRNIDWDGDRSSDEVFNTIGGFHGVYRLQETPSSSFNCAAGRATDPMSGPTWIHPHRWSFVLNQQSPSGHFDTMSFNHAFDFFGDYREELVIPGANGLMVIYNPATNPNAGRHPSPWKSEAYRRRFNGSADRFVDYAALPTLVSVAVEPATVGLTPGQTRNLMARGTYSDGTTADLTAVATFASGSPVVASVSGIVLTGNARGLASIRATVLGMHSSDAALAQVSTALEPEILYAGYGDTYLRAGVASDLVMEVRVVDAQNDVIGVVAALGGAPAPALVFADNGQNGDRLAGDGTWTARIAGLVAPAPGDLHFEAVAVDSGVRLSRLWPYVSVPSTSTAVPVLGVPVFPFASEVFGPVVKIAGSGQFGNVTASGGTVLALARVRDPAVTAIFTFLAGVNVGSVMNDSGLNGDQFAGDGLFSANLNFPSSVPSGRYIIEHLALSPIPTVSDVAPRLRTHQ